MKDALLTTEETKARYGGFYGQAKRMATDWSSKRFGGLKKENVPERSWLLIPYAELWGESDHDIRAELEEIAPPQARKDLRDAHERYLPDLLAPWPEEYGTVETSLEILSFNCLLMAVA